MFKDVSTLPDVGELDNVTTTDSDSLADSDSPHRLVQVWEFVLRLGLGEVTLRAATAFTSLILVLVVVWVMNSFYLNTDGKDSNFSVRAAPQPTTTPTIDPPPMEDVYFPGAFYNGITRRVVLDTLLPDKPRFEVGKYEVQAGDTIFGIAEKYNIKPETVMWGNYDILADNPHSLRPGQILNILPVDGVYYKWHAGDNLGAVATFYGIKPQDVINFPGNRIDASNASDAANVVIAADTWVMMPGGKREFVAWSAPRISRKNASTAKVLGAGACEVPQDGPVGGGSFVWPTIEKRISGYDYSPATNHYGIDIGGKLGYGVFAVDSGVVVYAGWNNWGYGNLVVVDHGNGWQSLYAHLNSIGVRCGGYVFLGGAIGELGTTGNSSGPHLHFELRSDEYGRPNPLNFLAR